MKLRSRVANATAIEAILEYGGQSSTPFVCPHPECGVYALHHWGRAEGLIVPTGTSAMSFRQITPNFTLRLAQCEACKREVVFVGQLMVWPRTSVAPPPHPDMPADCLVDYREAMDISSLSPRGAAALLRLSLEKLLPHIGATKDSINDAVGELVAKGVVPTPVQQALDSVRVVGNEAVHPGELDLRDDGATVNALFGLMNFIVEKAISEPKEIAQLYAGLPAAKLAGIENRDRTRP